MEVARLGKVLPPESRILVVVECVGQFAGLHSALFDDRCPLVGIEVEDTLGRDAGAVTPERVGPVLTALEDTRVPESPHLDGAMSAEPSGYDGALASTAHIAHVVAVGDARGRSAVHHDANEGTHIVAGTVDIALMAHIFECYPSAAVGAADDATHLVATPDFIARSGDEVFDDTASVDDTEDTDALVVALIAEVVDGVELPVEGAHKAVVTVADRCPCHIGHVDVGGEDGIGTVLATVDDGSEFDEVGGVGDLVDTIHLVDSIGCGG